MEMMFLGRVVHSEDAWDASEREEEREELSRGIWKETRTRRLYSATATAAHCWDGPHVEDAEMRKGGVFSAFAVNPDPTRPPDSPSVESPTTSVLHSAHSFFHWVVFALAYNLNVIVLVIPACLPHLLAVRRGVDVSNPAPFPLPRSSSLSTHRAENVGPNSNTKRTVLSGLGAFRMCVSCGGI
jgi:hypothetical protein